jgi:hypothetical protein
MAIMTRAKSVGVCEHCHKTFSYYLAHNGFNDSAYAYCDSCEYSVSLSGWYKGIPARAHLQIHKRISKDVEPFLKSCPCGGTFRADASPRCPHCLEVLSAIAAKQFIEANAPGSKKGWTWDCTWDGLYSIVIEDKIVEDWWKG